MQIQAMAARSTDNLATFKKATRLLMAAPALLHHNMQMT